MERTLWTDERVNDAMGRMDQRFDAVDERFEAIDKRFDAIDRRFNTVERRLDCMAVELREVRGGHSALNRQFGRIGWGIGGATFIQLVAIIVTRTGT
jgi:hypothetical protein